MQLVLASGRGGSSSGVHRQWRVSPPAPAPARRPGRRRARASPPGSRRAASSAPAAPCARARRRLPFNLSSPAFAIDAARGKEEGIEKAHAAGSLMEGSVDANSARHGPAAMKQHQHRSAAMRVARTLPDACMQGLALRTIRQAVQHHSWVLLTHPAAIKHTHIMQVAVLACVLAALGRGVPIAAKTISSDGRKPQVL